MYAAAGGASLASRQARQRQRQQKKTQQLQAKLHPPKASVLSVAEHGASTPTRHSRQFHQLPTNYLRTPQAQARKLSASYTAQSKLLLPIDEGDTQSVLQMRVQHTHAHLHHSHSHATAQSHHYHYQPYNQHQQQQQQQFGSGYHHGRVSPKLVHRHSGSSGTSFHHSHLPKSATATLPLVSQMQATPPTTPAGAVAAEATATVATASTPATEHDAIAPPHHDAIIVTPATPLASPGHVAKQQQQHPDELPDAVAEKQPLTSSYDEDEPMEPPTGPLERKCSVYRMRRSDAYEQQYEQAEVSEGSVGGVGSGVRRQLKDLQFNQQPQYEPLLSDEPQLVFKGLPNGRKWQTCAYCEEGICVCEHIECAQGRAAWLERSARRCSVQESQQQAAACHRRWVKRNRIQDASLGGSSDDEDFLGVLRGPSTFANAFLYVGLGTIALGLVIAFVGTGEKGFKTVELRLIGPSLIGIGLVCCILRILFCICPSHCISSSKKARKKNGNKVDADHTTSLLRGESKRVSIARGPSIQPRYPITHKRSNSKMLNEGMEALRQIATTSLFMQNEQKPATNRVVPIIKEPESSAEAPPLEMKKLDPAANDSKIVEDDASIVNFETTTINNNNNNNANSNYDIISSVPGQGAPITGTIGNGSPSLHTTNTKAEQPHVIASNSGNKLSRQRVALNLHSQQQQQQQQHQLQKQHQSQGISIDEDYLMETSLTVKQPELPKNESRPPPLNSTNHTDLQASISSSFCPVSSTTTTIGSGAIPRSTTTVVGGLSTPTSCMKSDTNAITSGAISRIGSAPHANVHFELPLAQTHTYASTLSASRSASERDSLIRGPLGMPLSSLTASSSSYAFSATSAQSTTGAKTTTPNINQRAVQKTPPLLSTIADSTFIPGQVPEVPTTYSPLYNTAIAPRSATKELCLLGPAPSTSNKPDPPLSDNSQPTSLTAKPSIPTFAASVHFKFPVPLSSTSSSSASSSASSNGRISTAAGTTATPLPTISTTTTATVPTSTATVVSSNNNSSNCLTLAPQLATTTSTTTNKFEPELLLSPAKLGQ